MGHSFNNSKEVQRIDKSVHELPSLSPECFLYRVHEGLHKVKPESYEPMLISIGPYHLGNHKLEQTRAMKTHKQRYLHSLLERRKEKSVESYFSELVKLQDKARTCYVDPIDLNDSEFVEMMLLDGCFIIEYFHKISFGNNDDDPILKVDWMKSRICLDMMLLENQLPYFVFSKLYDMTKGRLERPFLWETVLMVFNKMLPNLDANFKYVSGNDTKEIKHLPHLIHILCAPSFEERITTDEVSDQNRPLLEGIITENGDSDAILNQKHSVVELVKFGVKFKEAGAGSLFDIKFNSGLMEIPCFSFEETTYTFFRNLIAYEQHYSSDVKHKYFNDYVTFMDQLINSEEDVKLLRLEGIIVNLLGDDKEVSDRFNKIGEGLIVSSSAFYYSEVRSKVNKHGRQRRNKMMASLTDNYFYNPWVTISTIAAVILLLLTIAQTVAAFLSL